jgi:hypothetical protein
MTRMNAYFSGLTPSHSGHPTFLKAVVGHIDNAIRRFVSTQGIWRESTTFSIERFVLRCFPYENMFTTSGLCSSKLLRHDTASRPNGPPLTEYPAGHLARPGIPYLER